MSSQYIMEPSTSGKVILHTSVGEIEIELWSKEAPLACRNFVQLCLEGYYDGCTFHRLVKDFIIQGGDPTGTGEGGESIYGKPFKDEFHQRLRFNRRGLLGMANAAKDDNRSQFFITLGTEPPRELDRKHTLFGKVVGPTMFNMLKMNESTTDEEDRPNPMHKIIRTEVVSNPFKDIIPRQKEKKKKEKKVEKKKVETKKLNLLSFGDEEEEDQVPQVFNKKGKSAHDLLDDEKLSKQEAVTKDELADYEREDTGADNERTIERMREKMRKRKKEEQGHKKEEDEDLDEMIENEKKARMQEEIDRTAKEVKALQKEYLKALRKPKEKKAAPEPDLSENMKKYTNMKLKFKDKSKHLVKAKDPERESQTNTYVERFMKKLGRSNQEAILFDKKVDMEEDEKKEEKEEQFGVELDAEDEQGSTWMANSFVAQDEEDPNVTRAKDANMREDNEEWYALDDPRHPINRRRRGEVV